MPVSPPVIPAPLIHLPLTVWGLFLIGVGWLYAASGDDWVWAAFGVGGATILLAIWGFVTRRDAAPLLASLFLLAFGSVVAGAISDDEVFAATGMLLIGVLSVGGLIIHRLGRVARALEQRTLQSEDRPT